MSSWRRKALVLITALWVGVAVWGFLSVGDGGVRPPEHSNTAQDEQAPSDRGRRRHATPPGLVEMDPAGSGADPETAPEDGGVPRTVRFGVAVHGPTGHAVPGADVVVSWPKAPGREAQVLRTDTDGRATTSIPSFESIRVFARRLDLASAIVAPYVGCEDVGTLELVLRPAVTLSGTIAGRDGRVVPNAAVDLNTYDRAGFLVSELETRTDEHGAFAFDPVALESARRLLVVVEARGFATRYEHVRMESSGERTVSIVLESGRTLRARCVDAGGEPIEYVSFRARDGSRLGGTDASGLVEIDTVPQGTTLIVAAPHEHVVREIRLPPEGPVDLGDVVFEAGRPVAGRVALPEGTERLRWTIETRVPASGVSTRRERIAADGGFELLAISASPRELRLVLEQPDEFELGGPASTVYRAGTVLGGDVPEVRLPPPCELRVRVLDERTGDDLPLTRGWVSVHGPDGVRTTQCSLKFAEPRSSFRLLVLEPGISRVRFMAVGLVNREFAAVELEPGGAVDLEIATVPGED